MSKKAVFDKDDFGNRLANNTQLMGLVVAEFLKEAAGMVDELEQGIEAQDWPLVGRLAHRIKGASGEISAHAMSEDAREIEFAVKDNNVALVSAYFLSLKNNYALLEKALADEFA